MRKLKKLLRTLPHRIIGNCDQIVCGLSCNPYPIKQGDLFFCLKQNEIESYANYAIRKGAVGIVCETPPENINTRITYVIVSDINKALADIACVYYDNPSTQLTLVGVTGTNGKSTIATSLYELYTKLGYKVGLISTIEHCVRKKKIKSYATTPNPIILNLLLRDMVDNGCEYCFMEITSHSLANKYIDGLKLKGAIFTNLTHDHLDYHGTFDEYLRCKKSLFDILPSDAFALVNKDGSYSEIMVQDTKAQLSYYSLLQPARFNCGVSNMSLDRMTIIINSQKLDVKLIGLFNAYNLLAVYGTSIILGADEQEVLLKMSELNPVRGRLELVHSENGIAAFVDYAHTPDGLENVLKTIKSISNSNQRLICVCGCGGDRDKSKRPVMGSIAVKYADIAIFTSDNPRTESPESIINDITSNINNTDNFLYICDRREAITRAVAIANAGDIILVAGKGHEVYQIIGNRKIKFDDSEEIRFAFENLKLGS